MKPALRWIAVLPAAIGSYLLMALTLMYLGLWFQTSYGLWVLSIGSAIACPWNFIAVGWMVAPKFKTQTAIVLVTIHAVVVSVTMTLGAVHPSPSLPEWWNIAHGLIGIVATVVVAVRCASYHRRSVVKGQPSVFVQN